MFHPMLALTYYPQDYIKNYENQDTLYVAHPVTFYDLCRFNLIGREDRSARDILAIEHSSHAISQDPPIDRIQIEDAEPFSSALSILDKCEQDIFHAYQNFSSTGIESVNLHVAIQAIEKFEDAYRVLVQQDSPLAEELQYRLQDARKCIAKMNASSSQLTHYDLRSMATFFAPPPEAFYFDRETGKKYLQPNHSQLMNIGGTVCMTGQYAGVGVSRHVKLKDQICDILYLNKRKDQIKAESKPSFPFNLFKSSSMTPEIEDRIAIQKRLATQLHELISGKISDWNYEKCLFCAEKEILEYTQDESLATKSHAIIYFYKQVKSDS